MLTFLTLTHDFIDPEIFEFLKTFPSATFLAHILNILSKLKWNCLACIIILFTVALCELVSRCSLAGKFNLSEGVSHFSDHIYISFITYLFIYYGQMFFGDVQ